MDIFKCLENVNILMRARFRGRWLGFEEIGNEQRRHINLSGSIVVGEFLVK